VDSAPAKEVETVLTAAAGPLDRLAQLQVGSGVRCGEAFAHCVREADRWTDEHPVLLGFQQVERLAIRVLAVTDHVDAAADVRKVVDLHQMPLTILR
jgi:hypothetical protein